MAIIALEKRHRIRRWLLCGLGIITACAAMIELLPAPARQIVAVVALIAMLFIPGLIAALLCAVTSFSDDATGRVQFSLRALFVVVGVVALGLFIVMNCGVAFDYVLGVAFDAETIYSPDYSAIGWVRVRPGLNRQQVIKLLGQPVGKSASGYREVWHYTTYGPSETYHRREVHFSRGAVTQKLAELYID